MNWLIISLLFFSFAPVAVGNTCSSGQGQCYPSFEVDLTSRIAVCSTEVVATIDRSDMAEGADFSFVVSKVLPSQLSGPEQMICSSFLANNQDFMNPAGGLLHRCYSVAGFYLPQPVDFAMWCTESYVSTKLNRVQCETNLRSLALDFHPQGFFVSTSLQIDVAPNSDDERLTAVRGRCELVDSYHSR